MKYDATVIKGDSAILRPIPNSYLAPMIRVTRGQKLRIHLKNQLNESTTVHWHGLRVPPEMDGHPRNAILPGKSYIYDFEVKNRAGTYWFHPHPHQRTGFQAYAGLAGLFVVSDDEERAASLPQSEFDVPLVIQDRVFNGSNQLVYLTNPMEQMAGFLGDRILVNGLPEFKLDAAAGAYRFRVLNGSNSRIYKLAWQDGSPLTVIGTDGGLLEHSVDRDYLMLAPGERVELLADFSGRRGREVQLMSLPFSGATTGMMGGGMMMGMMRGGSSGSPQGAPLTILTVRVNRDGTAGTSPSKRLSTIERHRREDAINYGSPRRFEVAMRGMMAWGINGRAFEMEGVAGDETVKLNSMELWEFINRPNGMADMPHPMHIHGVQFQVLDRHVDPQFERDWMSVRAGYVDDGWKDTVLLWPGERTTLLMRFSDFPGLFMYHCHNLEHEDLGLMRNYLIQE
jgi:FtsP/CotA-like multicopper oxidase with cupredoxin domain